MTVLGQTDQVSGENTFRLDSRSRRKALGNYVGGAYFVSLRHLNRGIITVKPL